ncbi:MAG TPA: TIR domain-containing protein, partial [Aggregatilineales bacterium]|nr:TIR domain-containing protein [Aggregatilineales bacterium]
EGKQLLIFPSLMNQRRPLVELTEDEIETDASYLVRGDVKNIFAALVVLLNHTNFYRRNYQWRRQAQFEMGSGEFCGFKQIERGENEIELVLYYKNDTQRYTRWVFNKLFEEFMNTRSVNYHKFLPQICHSCGFRIPQNVVIRFLQNGTDGMFCSSCGVRIEFTSDAPGAVRKSQPVAGRPEERTPSGAGMSSGLRETLNKIRVFLAQKGRQSATCYVSHAWGERDHELWVARLAQQLIETGIEITCDDPETYNPAHSIDPLLNRIATADYILVVGTESYRKKYDFRAGHTGSAVDEEIDLIERRMQGSEADRYSVLPILLQGDEKVCLPVVMQEHVFRDFREERFYFFYVFHLVLHLYNISPQDPIMSELRVFLREGMQNDDDRH